jgi:HNH endonuclease
MGGIGFADLRSLPERIMEKVYFEPNSGCWIFNGIVDRDGYGRITPSRLSELKRRPMAVHRIMYENENGLIPEGLTIDHKCRVRCCCNPSHLRTMSNVENVMIGESLAADNARKTECKRGHPLSGRNLFIDTQNHRQCRVCMRMREEKAAARKRIVCASSA